MESRCAWFLHANARKPQRKSNGEWHAGREIQYSACLESLCLPIALKGENTIVLNVRGICRQTRSNVLNVRGICRQTCSIVLNVRGICRHTRSIMLNEDPLLKMSCKARGHISQHKCTTHFELLEKRTLVRRAHRAVDVAHRVSTLAVEWAYSGRHRVGQRRDGIAVGPTKHRKIGTEQRTAATESVYNILNSRFDLAKNIPFTRDLMMRPLQHE